MLKKMCPGLYPRLVQKLEGISSTKVQGKKKKYIYKPKSLDVPTLWSEPQVQPMEYLLVLGKASVSSGWM